MNAFVSSLYECRVFHRRYVRTDLRFVRRIFLFCIDLDELPDMDRRLRCFGYNRLRPFSFYDRDHFVWRKRDEAVRSTKDRVIAYLHERGADFTVGRVLLATNLRVFGYVFNPVSFYYCYDDAGSLRAVLSEVNNTYLEQKPFLTWIDDDESVRLENGNSSVERRAAKRFYVSPFIRHDTEFYFKFARPGELLRVRIDSFLKRHTILKAQIHGSRRDLNDRELMRMLWRYPLITIRIIAWIHVYALKLFLRKVFVFDKEQSDARIVRYGESDGVVCEKDVPPVREYSTRVRPELRKKSGSLREFELPSRKSDGVHNLIHRSIK